MRFLTIAGVVAVVLGALCLIASFVADSHYSGKSKLIQRVERNKGADLFGDSGTNIGSAQQMIIEDPKAFTGAKTPAGAEVVDEAYLKEHNIYPLQLQTVEFVASQVRLGSIVAIVVGGLVWFFGKRKLAKRSVA